MNSSSLRRSPLAILLAATLGLVMLSIHEAPAQATAPKRSSSTTDEAIPTKFWHAVLPGGQYMVALGRISNIGIHEYVANATARVYEVTIAADGAALARFYYMEPMTDKSPLNVGQIVADRIKGSSDELGKRTGLGDAWQKVVKDYPNTTHAHTIEFRLDYKDDLEKLFSSVQRAWETGRGTRFKIVNSEG